MKRFIAVAVLLSVHLFAASQQNSESVIKEKKVVCNQFNLLLSTLLKNEYKERITWIGEDDESETKFSLLVNEKTGTWTLLQFNKELACILGAGERHKFSFKSYEKIQHYF